MSNRKASCLSRLFSFVKALFGVTAKKPSQAVGSPLRLIVRSPDGKQDFPQETPPFKLCHGAEHRLEVKAPDGSTWRDQKLSLHWETERPEAYGVGAQPPFMVEGVLPPEDEKSFQYLSSETGANWTLTSRGGVAAQSGECLELTLGSYWRAPKYAFLAHVGDFHYAVTELQWDRQVPIVEPPTPSILTATVKSLFDDARVMVGKRVHFEINGTPYGETVPVEEDGVARFSYTPKIEDIDADNRVTVSAFCVDELGQTSERKSLTLPAYVSDAWPDELKVELRDKGVLIPASALGQRFTWGIEYTLTLIPDKGSFLVDQPIKLLWPEGAGQLGIELVPPDDEPENGRPLPETGLSWVVRGGAESGKFTLLIAVAGAPMPFLLVGVQMSANLADEADLSYEPCEPDLPLIFWRGVPKTVHIKPKLDSLLGLMELRATLEFVALEDDDLTEEQMPATPNYRVPSEVVKDSGVSWSLNAKGDGIGGRFGLEIGMPGFKTPLTTREAYMMSTDLGKEAKVIINGVVMSEQPLVLHRAGRHVVELVPRESDNSPLGRTALRGRLVFKDDSLTEDDVVATPPYEEYSPMSEKGLGWTLDGKGTSGTCSLTIEVEGFETAVEMTNVILLSEILSDEAQVKIDGKERRSLALRQKVPRTVSIVPRVGSPLRTMRLDARMTFTGGSLLPGSVTSSPDYGVTLPMEESGLDWVLEGQALRGTFTVDIHVKGFDDTLTLANSLLLLPNLSDEIQMVTGQANKAVYWRDHAELTALVAREGSPFEGRESFTASLEFVPRSHLTLNDVAVSPDYGVAHQTIPGVVGWTVVGGGRESGDFGLKFHIVELDESMVLERAVVVSRALQDEATIWPDFLDISKGATVTTITFPESSPIIQLGLMARVRVLTDENVKIVCAPKEGDSILIEKTNIWGISRDGGGSGNFSLILEVDGFLPFAIDGKV